MKRSLLCTVSTVAFLAACSSHDLTTPSSSLTLSPGDSAQAAALSSGDATAEDVDILAAAEGSMDGGGAVYDVAAIGGPSLSLLPATPSLTTNPGADSVRFAFWAFGRNCTFSATSGRFTCPDVVRSGLTLSRTAAFLDAAGTPMSHYNDTTTASANFQLSVAGVHVVSEGADTISRSRTMTVTNLLGHETSRLWNGTGTRADGGYRVDSAATRSYHTSDAVTLTNVAVSLPRSSHPWPISGTVTRQVSGTGTVAKNGVTKSFAVTKTVTITFNGTRLVPMTVGSMSFTLDLFTGKVVKT
jgi:hypothetical protein